MNLLDISRQIEAEVKKMGQKALSLQQTNLKIVEEKAKGDITTNADHELESSFHTFIKANFPEHGFRSEEFQELNIEKEYTWAVDAIDGTKFFYRGIPLWSVTVALLHHNYPVLGVTYLPQTDQLYSAVKGLGSKVNDAVLTINTSSAELNAMQVAWDVSASAETLPTIRPGLQNLRSQIENNFYRVREIGNGSISLAWVAHGLFSAYVCPYLEHKKFVDIAAGVVLAKEAGATIRIKEIKPGVSYAIVGAEVAVNCVENLLELYYESR